MKYSYCTNVSHAELPTFTSNLIDHGKWPFGKAILIWKNIDVSCSMSPLIVMRYYVNASVLSKIVISSLFHTSMPPMLYEASVLQLP